jgi:hypothetical protein
MPDEDDEEITRPGPQARVVANLNTLAGADKLTTVEVRWNAGFNALDDADLAAFAAQVGKEQCDINFDSECSCSD